MTMSLPLRLLRTAALVLGASATGVSGAATSAIAQSSVVPPQTPAKPAPPRAPPATQRTPTVTPPRHTHAEKPKATHPPAHGTTSAAMPKAGGKPGTKPETPSVPVVPPVEPPPPNPAKGSVTGQDLPRWASLRSEDVNLRVGPGTNFQIAWVYHRRDLPVQIEREYEVWRQVEDQDGVKGWVHQATLTGRRSFVVKDAERTLRRNPAEDGAPVARLKPGVVGRIRTCEANATWCEVQIGDYRGFLKREEFWGTFPNEAVN